MTSPSAAALPFGAQPEQRRDASAEPTPPGHPAGASIHSILAERQRQIDQFGHTPESDARLPLGEMPRAARDVIGGILDDIQFHKSPAQMRRRAVKAAALLCAFIDRLDAETPKDCPDA